MLRSRIIPSLLVSGGGLVKTVKFVEGKYVGDPINAVKIFNEKQVDELTVFDIDATVKGLSPDFNLIERLAKESRMPLCYGGGVKTAAEARRIIQSGIEKVAVSSAAIENPFLIDEIAKAIGSQSIVVVLDVKKTFFGGYDVYIKNGKEKVNKSLEDLCSTAESHGAGEIVINAIDRDGVMAGYDMKLVDRVRALVSTPMTVLGGAGSVQDIQQLVEKHGPIGAAAGSLFVFKGKYKAVLINYLSEDGAKSIHGI